ncbi:hypothetical protein Tco_1202807 [Tanacetum coccineum]
MSVVENFVVVMIVVKKMAVVMIVVEKSVVAYFLDSCNLGTRIVDFDDTPIVIDNRAVTFAFHKGETVATKINPTSAEEKQDRRNEIKARETLLMALPNKDQLKFHSYKDAKLLMEAIEKRYGGNKESKKVQRTLLKQQYENFAGSSSETMDQTFDRLQKLISQLEIQGEVITQEDMNLKLLRSLPSEWKTHALIWRNKEEIETISLDDLSKWKVLRIVKNGHFARECRAPRNQENRGRENNRRTVTVETSTENALVAQDGIGGYDWSYQAEEEHPTNYALMAYTSSGSSSSSDSEVIRPVWNNSSRVNHKNFANKMTHPHPYKRFVPQAVLTKSGKINTAGASVNTAVRPVNNAGSKTTVNHPRPISNAYKKGYSQVTKPFNKYSANKNSIFNKKVNIVRVKDTTARDRAIGNPQQKEYKEKGVIDSGFSRHMTGNKCYLTEYEDYDGGFVSFRDGKGRISGKGKIKRGTLDFDNQLFSKALQQPFISATFDYMYIKSYSFRLFSSLPGVLTPVRGESLKILNRFDVSLPVSHSLWSSQSFGHQKAINGFDMPLPVAVCSGLVNPLAPRKGKFHGGLMTMSTLCT